ncbi:MAG: type VI secretion system baseplate subunit TssE [Xanthomonadales bacterium]
MGQWSLKERLQPSLLDRLTDLHPDKKRESSSQQVLSQKQFKEAVIRDLGWLLNAVSMDSVVDLSAYPEVKHSVLNYGLPDISGHTAASIDTSSLEKSLLRAITEFEPRFIQNSLKVRVHTDANEMSHNSLVFEIEGVVFGQPMPFHVVLRSELDLECGQFNVREDTG